jgi:hypothetical protein
MAGEKLKADFKTIEDALWWAEKRGYTIPPMERLVFEGAHKQGLSNSLRVWGIGVLTTHEFAEAFFGHSPVDRYGNNLVSLRLWAKQVAVEHEGKLYAADRSRPEVHILKNTLPEVEDMTRGDTESRAPAYVTSPESVRIKLEDMYAGIPVLTHSLGDIDVFGMPAWKYHLQNMVIVENPLDYIREFMAEKIAPLNY